MMLSEHISLAEFVSSQTASRLNISNSLPDALLGRAKQTCASLEVVRVLLGAPIIISSGYRDPRINAAVGGVTTSAHCEAYAADILAPEFGSPLDVCRRIMDSGIVYDQLIYEFGDPQDATKGWTHISFDPRARRQTLHILRAGQRYQLGLPA